MYLKNLNKNTLLLYIVLAICLLIGQEHTANFGKSTQPTV